MYRLMPYCQLFFCLLCLGCLLEPAFGQESKEVVNSIGMKLILIPKGTFAMGSPETEELRGVDEFSHEVTISKDFYLGVTEVTQTQYAKVMGANPSKFKGQQQADKPDYPVENISWQDAVDFCKRLSDLPEEKAAGRVYRLPTEAEWEFACRAGAKTTYFFGNDPKSLSNHAWFGGNNNNERTHPVGQKKANAWGLYDMHGNVWEWCADWYGDYPQAAVTDPSGPNEGTLRVLRGGGWKDTEAIVRTARRGRITPDHTNIYLGFRIALTAAANSK